MHDIIDSFFERVEDLNLNIRTIDEEKTKEIIDELIEEKLKLPRNYIFISTAKFRAQTIKLKKLVLKAMKYIIRSIKSSEFEVLRT